MSAFPYASMVDATLRWRSAHFLHVRYDGCRSITLIEGAELL